MGQGGMSSKHRHLREAKLSRKPNKSLNFGFLEKMFLKLSVFCFVFGKEIENKPARRGV
jgi:hypothetical protein